MMDAARSKRIVALARNSCRQAASVIRETTARPQMRTRAAQARAIGSSASLGGRDRGCRTALTRLCGLLVAGLAAACATAAPRQLPGVPDWEAVGEVGTIEVVTVDPDGDPRETTIWLCVLDGAGYIRTGDTRWHANLERDPSLRVRIASPRPDDPGTDEYRLRVEKLSAVEEIEAVHAACRAKYGVADRVVRWLPGTGAYVMRLGAPDGSGSR